MTLKKWMVAFSTTLLLSAFSSVGHAAEKWLELSNNKEEGEVISIDTNSIKYLKNKKVAVTLKMSYDRQAKDIFQMGTPLGKVLMHLEIQCDTKTVQRLRMDLFKQNNQQVGNLAFVDDNIQFGGAENARTMASGICDMATLKYGK